MSLTLRDAGVGDLPAITAIYGHNVLHGTGTFEEVSPSLDDMTTRFEAIRALNLPWLVAEQAGEVIGYAYAGQFRARNAYRYTIEDSIYLAPGHGGKGVGKALLTELIGRVQPMGFRALLAVIGDSENHASIALHKALGFQMSGTLPHVGYKFGRWLDVVMLTLPLNGGDQGAPEGEGWA